MSNDVLMTQVLWPNFISTLIMVGCSALLSTVLGFLLATVLIVTNKQGLKPNPSVYRVLDFIINVVRSFPFIILMVALILGNSFLSRDYDWDHCRDSSLNLCYGSLCGAAI